MQKFNIIYCPSAESDQRSLITLPTSIQNLQKPLTITREYLDDTDLKTPKKKSEAIELFDENYLLLKNTEKNPYLLTDNEQRMFTGNLQETENYYILINAGNCFKLLEIKNFYRFSMKIISEMTLEEAENHMKGKSTQLHQLRIKKRANVQNQDVDFDKFDDDSDNDVFLMENEENELNETGIAIKKLMKNYENESSEESDSETGRRGNAKLENAKK